MRNKKYTNRPDMPQSTVCDGTYSFCEQCKKEDNCCVKVTRNGRINCPILFPEDAERIEKHTGISLSAFSIGHGILKRSHRVMKFANNGCFFCRNGQCSIYPVRPLDCRLFPFDILEKDDGSLVWIAYTKICRVKFDITAWLEKAKCLLPQLKYKVREYARADAPWKSGEPYVELESVKMPL